MKKNDQISHSFHPLLEVIYSQADNCNDDHEDKMDWERYEYLLGNIAPDNSEARHMVILKKAPSRITKNHLQGFEGNLREASSKLQIKS